MLWYFSSSACLILQLLFCLFVIIITYNNGFEGVLLRSLIYVIAFFSFFLRLGVLLILCGLGPARACCTLRRSLKHFLRSSVTSSVQHSILCRESEYHFLGITALRPALIGLIMLLTTASAFSLSLTLFEPSENTFKTVA